MISRSFLYVATCFAVSLMLSSCGGGGSGDARVVSHGSAPDRLKVIHEGPGFAELAKAGRVKTEGARLTRDGRFLVTVGLKEPWGIDIYDADRDGAPLKARLLLPQGWRDAWAKKELAAIPRGALALHADKFAFGHRRFRRSVPSHIEVSDWQGESLFAIPVVPFPIQKNVQRRPEGYCGIDFSPSGDRLAVCIDNDTGYVILIHDGTTGKKLKEIRSDNGIGGGGADIAFTPDGKTLITRTSNGGEPDAMTAIDMTTYRETRLSSPDTVWLFRTAPDGSQRLESHVHDDKSYLRLYELKSDKLRFSMPIKKEVRDHVGSGSYGKEVRDHAALGPSGQFAYLTKKAFLSSLAPEEGRGEAYELRDSDLDGHPLALAYAPEAAKWRVVTDKGIQEFNALTSGQVGAARLCHKAKRAGWAGMADLALRTAERAIEADPRRFRGDCNPLHFTPFDGVDLGRVGQLILKRSALLKKRLKPAGHYGLWLEKESSTVKDVMPEGAAERAGLKVGDEILAIDGRSFVSRNAMWKHLTGGTPVGAAPVFSIKRTGRPMTVTVPSDPGYADLQSSVALLFWIFEYGHLAAEAGHPGIVRQAARWLRDEARVMRSSWHWDKVKAYPIALDALALGWEGKVDEGLTLLAETQLNAVIINTISALEGAWRPFYDHPAKFAFVLNKETAEIRRDAPGGKAEPAPYPARDGTMMQPVTAAAPPSLAPALSEVPDPAPPAPAQPGAMVLD